MKDRILIIDGLNFIYRGVLKFNQPGNKPDYSIVYNFFRNLRALVEQMAPNRCFFVLEGNPIFRKELYPDYKKNRIIKQGSNQYNVKTRVIEQAEIIHRLLRFLPFTLVKADFFEADDVINTLAHDLKDEDLTIVSTDSDLIQILQSLSTHSVELFNPTTKMYVTPPDYVYVAWKSIAGDKSDHIPSIKSSEEAEQIASSPELFARFFSIEEHKANFLLNKNLIELKIVPEQELILQNPNVNLDLLFSEFSEMGFFSILKEKYKEHFISTFLNIK